MSRAAAGGDWEQFAHPPLCVRCWFGASSPIRQSSDITSVGLEQLQLSGGVRTHWGSWLNGSSKGQTWGKLWLRGGVGIL